MAKGENIYLEKDELTGLLTKEVFTRSSQELMDDMTEDSNYAVIFFDVENFKLFNVNYGYESGDELLINIAFIIQELFEKQLVSRFSGDHFVVFASRTQIVPAIREVRHRVKLLQQGVNLELKAGVYLIDENDSEIKKCVDRARLACVSIKRRYDVEYRFYDQELDGSIQKKQFVLDNLENAIKSNHIKIYFQPILRSLTGKICAWEALVRWIDPIKGMVFPNDFIPVLEEYRLITILDTHVIERVISGISSELKKGRNAVPVSINLSRIDFEIVDIPKFIDDCVEKYGCPKDLLHFEITESALMENKNYIIGQVVKLREAGYDVWMDDFGSGYSSLNTLRKIEFDLIKIDMDFLKDFENTDNGKIILTHTVSLVKNLGIHTLVEGVETQEQYDYLKMIGCELMQGYFIGKPMSLDEVDIYLQNTGREREPSDERFFYNAIGMVDFVKQNPLENIETKLNKKPLPLALGVVQNEKWQFIYMNEAYAKEIQIYGHENQQVAEKMINNRGLWDWYDDFWGLLNNSKQSMSQETMEFIENGHIVSIRARYIGQDKEQNKDAYMVTIRSIKRFADNGYGEKYEVINKHIFSFYECIDLYGISAPYYENVYLEKSRLHLENKNKLPKTVINELAELRIHKDDKARFLGFMNLDTVSERIKSGNNKKLIGAFRVMDVNGTYVWKILTITEAVINNTVVMLCCVAKADNRLFGIDEYDTKRIDELRDISENTSEVVENVLKLTPIGIFWKDSQRRFMGANQMFLDYYGFNTVGDILGKTDEDMGWHIDPEPFKQDELRVINEDAVIENVYGECIVKGKVRNIIATKKPFKVGGKTVGLLGFFIDVTNEVKQQERLETLSMTDELTGIFNRRGFNEVVAKYEETYKRDKTDFALFILDVDKFKQINDIYGHDFGDIILKNASEMLQAVAAEHSVVFRFGGDEFIILHQIQRASDVDNIMQDVAKRMEELKNIDGVEIRVKFSIGVAIYSEANSLSALLDLADKRMYEDKANHKKMKY